MRRGNSLVIRLAAVAAALIIAGVAILVSALQDRAAIDKGVLDVNSMTAESFEKGRYVESDIYLLLDEFAYEQETSSTFGIKTSERTSSHFYVLSLLATGDEETVASKYVALKLSNAQSEIADDIVEAFWAEELPENYVWPQLHVVGKITEMDKETKSLFLEYMTYVYGDAASADSAIVPYVIEYRSSLDQQGSLTLPLILLGVGIVIAVLLIIVFVKTKKETASVPQDSTAAVDGVSAGESVPDGPVLHEITPDDIIGEKQDQ